jgi:D-amino-acid dehydrogenase
VPLAKPGLLRQIPGWLRPGGSVHIRPRASIDLMRFGVKLARSSGRERMIDGLRTLRDLSRSSRDLFEDLVGDGLDFGYRHDGVMNVCATEATYQELCAEAELLRQEGFDPEILSPDEARKREPLLRPTIAGAVFWPEDGHCEPGRFVEELARLASQAGASIKLQSRVTGFQHDQDGSIAAVQTNGSMLRPRTVVFAAGSWTGRLARLAGTRIPIEAGKGYHVHLSHNAPRVQAPLIFQESVFAATPMGDALRLAGTMEFVGVDLNFAEQKARRLLEEARQYLDGLDAHESYETWCGLRPCTPDSVPILGSSVRIPNLVLATGHSMLGITLAPVSGRIVADVILDGSSDLSASRLSPARFHA